MKNDHLPTLQLQAVAFGPMHRSRYNSSSRQAAYYSLVVAALEGSEPSGGGVFHRRMIAWVVRSGKWSFFTLGLSELSSHRHG